MGERSDLARQISETIARDAIARQPHPGVERALSFMRQNVNEPVALSDLADAAYLSPFHLTRLFRAATGASPGAFLAALKLAEAKRLLLTTDMPVAEVCFAVGYRALGTFTSRFTRLVGVPPRQLRRLPELIATTEFAGRGLPPASAARRQSREYIVGRVEGPADLAVPVAVGLFPGAIPQGRPLADLLLAAPGPFALPRLPDGAYHLLAATLPLDADPLALLVAGPRQWIGRSTGPIRILGGRVFGSTVLTLRPARPLDPPLLLALPALLFDPLAPHHRPPV